MYRSGRPVLTNGKRSVIFHKVMLKSYKAMFSIFNQSLILFSQTGTTPKSPGKLQTSCLHYALKTIEFLFRDHQNVQGITERQREDDFLYQRFLTKLGAIVRRFFEEVIYKHTEEDLKITFNCPRQNPPGTLS